MRDLSRLPDRSIFGLIDCQHHTSPRLAWKVFPYFSKDVAKLVTHPEWPSRVPRITNCSAMLGKEVGECLEVLWMDTRSAAEAHKGVSRVQKLVG